MVKCYISRNVTFDKDFTPYIHVLVYHASQFHSKFGSLRSFEMEEVEHLNYTNKLVFYGASKPWKRRLHSSRTSKFHFTYVN